MVNSKCLFLAAGLALASPALLAQDVPPTLPAPATESAARSERLAETLRETNLAAVRAGELRALLDARRQSGAETRQRLHDRFEASQNLAKEVAEPPRSISAADSQRTRANELFGELRILVADLRGEVAAAKAQKIAAEGELAEARAEEQRRQSQWLRWSSEEAEPLRPPPLEPWRGAVKERLRLANNLVELEEEHRDQVFVLLKKAQTLRLGVKAWVSRDVWILERAYLVDDLKAEARLTAPLAKALLRHHWQHLEQLPARVADVDFLGQVTVRVLWALVTLILWAMLRHRVPMLVPGLLRFWADRMDHYVGRDLWSMKPASERTVVALVDLSAIAILLQLVRTTFPEVGLLLLFWLQLALYKMILGLASLALATYPEVRPCLMTLRAEARQLALKTVRWLVLWLIAGQFLRYIALEILAAVTLHEVLGLIFHSVLLPILGLWIFHRWEPLLRESLRRRAPLHPLVRFQTGRQLRVLRCFQGMAHALLYGYLWLRDLIIGFGGWASILQPWRRKTREDVLPEKAPALPEDVVKQLFRRECGEDGYTARQQAHDELDNAVLRWRTEKRRGVAMVLGEEGMGKRVFLDRWLQALSLHEDEFQVIQRRLGERLTNRRQAREWVAKLFEIEDPPDDKAILAGRINSLARAQVVIVEALQFSFLRRVDGFAGLREFLSIVAATCDQVFWVLSMHRPAWRYLASLGGLVHTGVCQRVIHLEGFTETELRWIIEQRINTTGHRVDFSPLLPRGLRRNPDPLALEQVAIEYFRRLTWTSQGNPTAALRLWRETLVPSSKENELRVLRYTEPPALPHLRDTDLFLLAAVYTHRSLTEDELVAVTNMNPSQVGARIRDLEARWLLTTRSKRYSLDPRYLSAITEELRQRHFIHGSA